MNTNKPRKRLLRLAEVMSFTGMKRSTIYRHIADGLFPKQVMITERLVGWDEDEIQDWILKKLEAEVS